MSEKGKQEWFAEWFDTSYYHILYKNRDFNEAERFISNLLEYLDLPKDANCLDLACGKGRHSVFLNEKGYNVTGVDLSPESIQAAKVFENERLNFDVHDMREVYRPNAFDVIFNLFTSFGYFESDKENERVLNAIHSMLKPDGVVVIDFMNAHKTIKNLVSKETKEVDNIVFTINRSFDGTHIIKDIQFSDDGSDFSFQERVQGINEYTFIQFFDQTGFEIIDVFGDFSLDAFDLESSDRLIFICKKK